MAQREKDILVKKIEKLKEENEHLRKSISSANGKKTSKEASPANEKLKYEVNKRIEIEKKLEQIVKERTSDLQENQKRLQLALESTSDGFWEYDIALNKLFLSSRFYSLLGYEEKEFNPNILQLKKFIHKHDVIRILRIYINHRDNKSALCEIDYEIKTKNGDWIWILCKGKIVERDNENKPVKLIGTISDVTETKKNESFALQMHLFEKFVADVSSRLIYVQSVDIDQIIEKCLGELSCLIGANYSSIFVFNKDMSEFSMTHHWNNGGIVIDKNKFKNKSAECFPWWKNYIRKLKLILVPSVTKLPDEAKNEKENYLKLGVNSLLHIPFLLRDNTVCVISFDSGIDNQEWRKEEISYIKVISQAFVNALQRQEAEIALQSSEEKYRLIVEQQSDIVAKFDTDNKLTFVSPSYCQTFGKTEYELLGSSFLPLVHESDQDKTLRAMKSLYKPPFSCNIEQKILTINGWKWFAWSYKAIIDKNENVTEIIGAGRDITSRKNAQLALHRHVKEMDTLNRFLRQLTSSLTINDVVKASVDTLSKSFENVLVAFFMVEEEKTICKYSNIKEFDLSDEILGSKGLLDIVNDAIHFSQSIYSDNDPTNIIKSKKQHSFAVIPCSDKKLVQCSILFCIFGGDLNLPEQTTFLETMCNEISVSLQNAYLYEEIKIHSNELFRANKDLLEEISIREKVERALKESEHKFKTIFDLSPYDIAINDAETGVYVEVNDTLVKHNGRKKEEIIGKTPFELNEAYDVSQAREMESYLRNYGRVDNYEMHVNDPENNVHIINFSSRLIKIQNKDYLLTISNDITESKKFEEQLKNSEEKYRGLFENAADGIIIFDNEQKIIDVNASLCKLIKKNKNELINKDFLSLFPPGQRLEFEKIISGTFNLVDQNLVTVNNKLAPVEINFNTLGKNIYQAFFRDISQRTLAEQKLVETNNLLEAINHASPDIIFILNIKTWKFSYFNNRLCEFFRYSAEEIHKCDNVIDLIVFDDDFHIPEIHFGKLLKAKDNEIIESELRFKRKDGKILWGLIREQVFSRDSRGNVVETVGVINDISERKRAAEEIIHTNNFLQAIFNASPDVIYVSDYKSGKVFYISKKIEAISLYSLEECINSPNIVEQLLIKEDKEEYNIFIEKLQKLKEDESLQIEFRIKRKDKSIIWVKVATIVFSRDNNGNILQTLSILREITDQKIAYQKISESESKFRNIFNNSTDGIAIINKKYEILEANHSLLKITGLNKEKILNTQIIELFGPADKDKISAIITGCYNKKPLQLIESEIIGTENNKIPAEVEFKQIEYEGEKAVLTLIRDITERKEAEKRVFEAILATEEKERETFAKNLHDDLGPLLSSIRMYLNSFQDTNERPKQEYIINQVNNILKEAIQCTKEVSNDLSPHILTNYGISSAVESFIAKFTEYVNISFDSNIKTQRFENTIEMSFYRVIKELVNNTIKHAGATLITISLNYSNNKINLVYTDNGIGIKESGSEKKGMGLINIKNRVKTINGAFEPIDQAKGVKFHIVVPVKLKPVN